LKTVLLRQFGKSKWQSYFELLRLPMDMQGLKPSIIMGKLKQHLPPGVSPNTDLFTALFLIRLPPSMREAVGAGNHKTAADTVRAANALWDARGGHDPTVAAATPHRRWEDEQQKLLAFPPCFPRFSEPCQWRVQVSQLLLQ
jgi:hypothetical protein